MRTLLMMSLVAGASAWGQTVSISALSAPDGLSGSLLLKLASAEGKRPVALQWSFSFPAGIIVDASDLVAGSAAESAKKKLTCAAEQDRAKEGGKDYRCILFGGQTLISNGVVAMVHYRVDRKAVKESPKVHVQGILAVGGDGKPASVDSAQTAIAYRQAAQEHPKP